MVRTRCLDCKHRFDLEMEDLEEGDLVPCPECNFEMTLVANKKGDLKLTAYKDKLLDDDEFDSDEDAAGDYESVTD